MGNCSEGRSSIKVTQRPGKGNWLLLIGDSPELYLKIYLAGRAVFQPFLSAHYGGIAPSEPAPPSYVMPSPRYTIYHGQKQCQISTRAQLGAEMILMFVILNGKKALGDAGADLMTSRSRASELNCLILRIGLGALRRSRRPIPGWRSTARRDHNGDKVPERKLNLLPEEWKR
ncbi:hypothetical protein EVAR_4646_1 [Eumeta japonica]|uniref:Uncharacterized protein n=1 Tax=Eumeta variegata TaxID=151549 RepID=A0A4C1YD43_EUMVA|nr:hypothetical protein EVAR_4646_1 [Eumeta japonica]